LTHSNQQIEIKVVAMPLGLNPLFVFIVNALSKHKGKEICSTLLAFA